jgi:hypothetical protein
MHSYGMLIYYLNKLASLAMGFDLTLVKKFYQRIQLTTEMN